MCAAPVNNQFWKLRSRHGREKLFASPKLLLKAGTEYFQWCDDNPWIKKEQLKKPYYTGTGKRKKWVTIADIPTQRPYTLSGFGIYCNASERFLQDFERVIVAKNEDELTATDKDFLKVITYIREVISTQQLEGATVGAFNANIISRKLGLSDKQELNHKGIPQVSNTFKVEIVRPNDEE